MGNGIWEGLPVVPNPSLHPAPGPLQAVESPFPGEGGPPHRPRCPLRLRLGERGAGEGAWILRSLWVVIWQEGTGSEVEGFRLDQKRGPGPRFGKGKDMVCPGP